MKTIVAPRLHSLAHVDREISTRAGIGLVQTRWHADPAEHLAVLQDGVLSAVRAGAGIVFLQELTLSRYFADTRPARVAAELAEPLEEGPTHLAAAQLAGAAGVPVVASLFERSDREDGLGYNTAIVVSPDGTIINRTRKMHIPRTAGYYEDAYFRGGDDDADAVPYPVIELEVTGAHLAFGTPTCFDQWFPEVSRAYALGGASLVAYPTAIGSEPDHPDFDTLPVWRTAIAGQAIANGTYMVVPNRYGNEGNITFYGGSFIADPYGRIVAEAPRGEDCVVVASLDLGQRQDWLNLFPLLAARRPASYKTLGDARLVSHPYGA